MTTLHLAAYDPDSRNPQGPKYWSWFDEHIPQGVLNITWSAVRQAVTGGTGHGDQFANRDRDADHFGIVALDDEWCCYFRVVERGLDVHGRPGKYAVLCGFARREFSGGINPERVWERLVYDELLGDLIANRPVPRPSQMSITVPSGAIASDFRVVERMGEWGLIRCPDEVTWDEFCQACGSLPRDRCWTVIVKQRGSSRTGTIRRSPRSGARARPSDSVRQPVTPVQNPALISSHPKPPWPRLYLLLLLLGTYSIGIFTGVILVLPWTWHLPPSSTTTSASDISHMEGRLDPPVPPITIVSPPPRGRAPKVDFNQLFIPAVLSGSVAFLVGLVLGNITRIYFGWQVPWVISDDGRR